MKYINKSLFMLSVLIVSTCSIYAQSVTTDTISADMNLSENGNRQKYAVKFLARSYGDSIVLRWAPLDAGVWMYSNQYGWDILRSSDDPTDSNYYLNEEGDTIPYLKLNGDIPYKPMSLDEMKKNFDSTNLYAGVAAQAMYGTLFYDVNKADQNNDLDFFGMAAKQYQEQTQRQFMAYLASECDPKVAEAMALRFVDKNVKPGYMYEYTLISRAPRDMAPINGQTILKTNKKFVRQENEDMSSLEIIQLDAYRAVVRWGRNQLSGYYIERSVDGGEWKSMSEDKTPIWAMNPDESTREVYGDTIAEWMKNYVLQFDSLELHKTYRYRVRAFDAFGDKTDWKESESFEMLDLIPPAQPILHDILPIDNKICKLEWDMYRKDGDLKGFIISFATTLSSPWENVTTDILPPSTRSYTDSLAQERGRGYYRVFAADTMGNISYSPAVLNFIEDVTPPKAPTGLDAITDDSTGAVYLQWNPNKEKDLLAYKVYFANQKDHQFIECEGYIKDTYYLDTVDIKTLTLDIYYYVIAVDENHNYSETSDTIRVKLPDFYAPTKCMLENLEQDGDTIRIRWHRSISSDVQDYFIYRKFRESPNWEMIAQASPNDVSSDSLLWFVDTPEPSRHIYTYCIEAIDSARNSSGMSGFANVLVLPSSTIDINIELDGKYSKKSKSVELSWAYEYKSRKDYYGVVYRSVNGGSYVDIATFKRTDRNFIDDDVPANSDVSYYIQLQLGRGQHSKVSNTIEVKSK